MEESFDSKRVNFWTFNAATEPIDGFSDFPHETVMKVFRGYRDMVEFSLERDGSTLTLHVWGPYPTLKMIKKELRSSNIDSDYPDEGEKDEPRHLAITWG